MYCCVFFFADFYKGNSVMFRTIQPRLLLLSALPFSLAFYFIGSSILDSYNTVQNMNLLMVGSQLAVKSSALIHESQKERGATSLFLGSDGNKFVTELSQQYQRTDLSMEDLADDIESISFHFRDGKFHAALGATVNQLQLIELHREKVNAQSVSDIAGIEFYTQLNGLVLDVIDLVIKSSTFSALRMESSAYINFLRGKEYSGLERAVLIRAL